MRPEERRDEQPESAARSAQCVLVRSPHRIALHRAVEGAVGGRKWRGVEVAIDVDPINIL